MGMKYLGVVEHHFCCMETTSSNCWTCSWLPPLWIFIARGWLICLWCHLVSRWGIMVSLYTTNSTTIWCCSLVCTICDASMFGAFTHSCFIGCTCWLSCICASS
jgi:hypothetical protein